MAMFKPSQSYSGGVIVDPYTGNIAQDLQFLSGEDRKKKTNPILDWVAHGNPVKTRNRVPAPASLESCFDLVNHRQHGTATVRVLDSRMINIKQYH